MTKDLSMSLMYEKDEVRRYGEGDVMGIVVAGGNGDGDRLNQLNQSSSHLC